MKAQHVHSRRAWTQQALSGALKIANDASRRIEGYGQRLPSQVTAADHTWASQNARLIVQLVEMLAAGDVGEAVKTSVAEMHPIKASRDLSMAQNAAWILDQAPPGAKVVVWAHNLHVSRSEGWMGAHLAKRYGDELVVIGFAFAAGSYRTGLEVHEAAPPPAESVERLLQETGLPALVLDLRKTPPRSPVRAWFSQSRPFRAIGPVATHEQFFPTVVGDAYNILVYFDRTTPTTLVSN